MRDPDLTGLARAWKLNLQPARRDQEATLEAWLVHGGFHPCWTYWMVYVIHLREIPGVPPAAKRYPEAQYEFAIWSLESPPGCDVRPDPDDQETWRPLVPPDVVYQFHGADDDQARRLAELAVSAIVEGRASPDSDWRSWWLGTLPRTLEHVVTGGHAS